MIFFIKANKISLIVYFITILLKDVIIKRDTKCALYREEKI